MGKKYMMRTSEKRVFPLDTIDYTDYYTNSTFEIIKWLFQKRGRILYVTKWF